MPFTTWTRAALSARARPLSGILLACSRGPASRVDVEVGRYPGWSRSFPRSAALPSHHRVSNKRAQVENRGYQPAQVICKGWASVFLPLSPLTTVAYAAIKRFLKPIYKRTEDGSHPKFGNKPRWTTLADQMALSLN